MLCPYRMSSTAMARAVANYLCYCCGLLLAGQHAAVGAGGPYYDLWGGSVLGAGVLCILYYINNTSIIYEVL